MSTRRARRPAVLTIAGSDSSGGAGMQADIATFESFDVAAATATTCETIQDASRVHRIDPLDPDWVASRIETACGEGELDVIKIGMLYSRAIVQAVCDTLAGAYAGPLVIDPVFRSSSGATLLQDDAYDLFCERLAPQAMVLTPNVAEAERLSGLSIHRRPDAARAARDIAERFGVACIVTGGHLPGDAAQDILYDHGSGAVLSAPRVPGPGIHGSGCRHSAALTALLALGESLEAAARGAQSHVVEQLRIA